MKRLFLTFLLCLMPVAARATYVQSGKHDFVTASSTACSQGSATAGNIEIMTVQANSATSTGISSTRVTTWVQDQAILNGSGVRVYLWHGIVTSSGTETITVTLSGSTTTASICAEYSTTTVLNATSGNGSGGSTSVTTTAPTTTIIEVGSSPSSGTTTTGGYTQRQGAVSGGTTFLALGDLNQTSTGTYSASFSDSFINPVVMDALTTAAALVVRRHR